jgi:hypothetical protein
MAGSEVLTNGRIGVLTEADDAQNVIEAYEQITQLAPSMVRFPELLHAEIHRIMDGIPIGLPEALRLLRFERSVRTLYQAVDSSEEALTEFYDQLRARLVALHAEEALSDRAFAELDRFLSASKNVFTPL